MTEIGKSDIDEHLPHAGGVAGEEIVVAENEVNAQRRRKLGEHLWYPIEEFDFVSDVAGYHNQIGLKGIGLPDGFLKVFEADVAGEMEVGELGDGKAIQLRRELRG